MLVQILIDNPNSWMIPYANLLVNQINKLGYTGKLIHKHDEVVAGDILCLLSCHKKFTKLKLNKYNLVAHSSDLPKGRGWSPLTWQILEGKNTIVVSLFEAVDEIDAGDIYYQGILKFDGHELLDELLKKQAECINGLILEFINNYPNNFGTKQTGEPSFYMKRTPSDSELELDKSINDQFNLLRVCDNNSYPAFFVKEGHKYILKIEKAEK